MVIINLGQNITIKDFLVVEYDFSKDSLPQPIAIKVIDKIFVNPSSEKPINAVFEIAIKDIEGNDLAKFDPRKNAKAGQYKLIPQAIQLQE